MKTKSMFERKLEIKISKLRFSFLLNHIWYDTRLFFKIVYLTIISIWKECLENLKDSKRISFGIKKEKCGKKGWSIKFIFLILIIDVYYLKEYEEWDLPNKIGSHWGFIIWLNSWKIAKLWGSLGTNMARIWHYCSTKKIVQSRFPSPLRYLKRLVILQEMKDTEELYNSICNDPMCGCPGDFAEDGNRKLGHLESQLWKL